MARLFGFLSRQGDGEVRELALSGAALLIGKHCPVQPPCPNTTAILDSALGDARDVAVNMTEIISRLCFPLK